MKTIREFRARRWRLTVATGTLERAEDILVTARHCSTDEALDEMERAAQRYDLGVLRVARALIRLSRGVNPEYDSFATAVARYEWGALLCARTVRT